MAINEHNLTVAVKASAYQQKALGYVEAVSMELSRDASRLIQDIAARNGIAESRIMEAISAVTERAPVAIHFHPDRLVSGGMTVIASVFESGTIQNQFETGHSSGALAPFKGGVRDSWEQKMFGGTYQQERVPVGDRPKYGALDLMGHADGPAPRFGSCYFLLSPAISHYCSFSEKDSYYEPEITGTTKHFSAVFAELLRRVEAGQNLMGVDGLSLNSFVERCVNLPANRVNSSAQYGRALDDYLEAQLHCTVDLAGAATALVADPSFIGTKTGHFIEAVCKKYGLALRWHPGYVLSVNAVPDSFRGPEMPSLARRVGEQGIINAAILGKAARAMQLEPEKWMDIEDPLQQVKKLWHVLVNFGEPLVK